MISPADADTTTTDAHEVDLSVGENVITATVTAEDGSTTTYTATVTRAAEAPSDDATLSSLSLSNVILVKPDGTTGFAPQTKAYTASVPFDIDPNTAGVQDETTVSATAASGGSTPAITPADANATDDGHQVALNVGANVIRLSVTEGSVTNTYTVTVTRIANNDASLASLSLSAGELSPKFAAGTTAYTASVPNDTNATSDGVQSSITITAAAVSGASVQLITPGAFDSDAGTSTLDNLAVDTATRFTVTVVAADGTTQQSYTVTATRAKSSVSSLSAFSLDGISLTPDFAPATTSYTGSTGNDDDQTAVTATATSNTAAPVVISPTDADTSTTDAHEVDLSVGENVITATVTAEDGSTTTYTATVTRAALPVSGDSSLSAFSLSGVQFANSVGTNVSFVSGTTSYMANVDKFVTSTNVTATASDAASGPTGAGATVVILPADADATADGHQVNLELGENTISAIVTSSDGSSITTYTAEVIRAYGGATLTALSLSGVTLSPDFSAAVTSYSGSVAHTVANTTVTTTAVAGATTAIQGADGTAISDADGNEDGLQAALAAGSNTINVVVTSSDGTAQTTYTVKVFKVHATAHLTALSLGDGVALSPAFAAGTIAYTADVGNETMQVTVTSTAVTGATTAIQDADGMAIEDADADTDGHQVNLALGANTIKVAVSAGTGNAAVTTTYTVVVTRGASTDATLSALSLSGITLAPAFNADTTSYTANVANAVANTTVTATATHTGATVSAPSGQVALAEGGNTITVTVTAADGTTTKTYTVVVAREVVKKVAVPGPTVTQTRTVTRTVTETVEVPAPPNVIGGTGMAMATEADGRVLITRHDGGPSLAIDIGGFIRDESMGQTYQVVRRADGAIVRQWVSPNSPLVYQIPWAVVNTQFTVPVGVILTIPLDDQSGSEGQLARRFDGGDDRIFSYDAGQWRHVPDIPTLQALGLYWCDVTAADSGFFDRISIGPAHPASDQPARSDYPNCSTG